jgi:NADPH-dependent 7-cyano-7-deazaguanine reductase QueF-like protein
MYSPDGVYGGSSGYYPVPDVATKQKNDKQVIFDNYEIAHFRLMTDVNYLPYGRAYIEPARRLYKQYALMEDAMLIHRITRSPDRRVFKINVGSIPPNEVDQFMQKTISTMKRTPLVNEQTGEYNLKYNSQNLMEDFYIPVRGNDTSTSIENLSGLNYDGIADVNYLRDKLFAALRVPKAFMGYDENLQGKATLAAEDIRFARTIDRIQRIILSELYKIAIVHLYTQGYTADNLANFELNLTTPSIIYDQERIALMKEKMDLAAQMLETKLVSSDWIYENVFHFSQDQYEEMRDLVVQDQKRAFRFKQIGEEGNDPLETGKSYGTPHDLASLYGRGRYSANELPDGYDEKAPLGRPKEKVSNINTQDNAFGRDRLGRDAMKNDDQEGYGRPKKDVSPLALEIKAKNKTLLESLEKKIVFNKTNNGESLLDESNLKE